MDAILQQLGLDQSFFAQFAIFAILFLFVSNVFFRPFLRLFEYRDQRTVQDREAAEKLINQAEAKFEEYRRRLSDERIAARKGFEAVLAETKKEEATLLANAREEAKKITQAAAESVAQQRDQLVKQLDVDVESLAHSISQTLLSRK